MKKSDALKYAKMEFEEPGCDILSSGLTRIFRGINKDKYRKGAFTVNVDVYLNGKPESKDVYLLYDHPEYGNVVKEKMSSESFNEYRGRIKG